MGTRALVAIEDEDGEEIAVLYRHFDGYPAALGAELAEFLGGRRLVYGYTSADREGGAVNNGMGCLAASLVAHFKREIGNVYLYPAGTRDAGEEYIYTVRPGKDGAVDLQTVEAGR